MQCPSCGADIKDPAAVFCPRCATPLGAEAGEATARIDPLGDAAPETTDGGAPDTAALEPVASPVRGIKAPRIDVEATRARLEATGWLDIAAVAGLGFLVLLAIGAMLVVAAKLNFPALGAGGDLLGAFTAVVLAALGVLGIPIVVDGVAVSALPLGALAAAGWGFWWAVSATGRRSAPGNLVAAARWGARLALPVALLCWFFALVFRFRGEHPVAADAGIAFIAGGFWGVVFGIIAAAAHAESLRAILERFVGGVRARSRRTYEGLVGGATMLAIAAVMGAAAVFLWIIVALIRDPPGRHFGAGDAVAYLVYLAAFLPNVVVAVIGLAFGAPLEVGAKVDLGGRMVGPLRDYSLWQWGGDDPLGILMALIVIPLVACVWGGVRARQRADGPDAMLHVLLVASGVFAVAVTLLGAVGRLRLAGVVKGSGYASAALDPVAVFFLSFLVCGILGAVGWKLGGSSNVPALRGDE